MTSLKYMMHKANLHNDNPALFKKVNDMALKTQFEGVWNQQEFKEFFLGKSESFEESKQAGRKPPTLDEMVTMFEMLDTNRDEKISKTDICMCLNILANLRQSEVNFDLDKYIEKYENVKESS